MTQITKLKTSSKFEDIGSYSRLVMVDNWIFVSNTAGRNPETNEFSDDPAEQTEQVFRNIEKALHAVESSLEDVIFSRVFVPNQDMVMPVMEVVGRKFKGIDPATTISCPPLGNDKFIVEIELKAYKGAGKSDIKKLKID